MLIASDNLLRLETELEEWNSITKQHQDDHAKNLDNNSESQKSILIEMDKGNNLFKDFLSEVDDICFRSDTLVEDFNSNTQYKVRLAG